MDLSTQQSILTEITKGEYGKVLKSALTAGKVTELEGLVGQTLDCRFDFTRTDQEENEIVEDMYCGEFTESFDGLCFCVDRDMLANYSAGAELTALEAKTKITLA